MMIRAFVQITGVDPDKVTKAVGIKPDESWRKGDISSFHEGQIATVRRRKIDFWCITTQTEDPFISIGDLLRELAGRLRSVSAKISSLRNVGHVSCSVWVDFDPRVERLERRAENVNRVGIPESV